MSASRVLRLASRARPSSLFTTTTSRVSRLGAQRATPSSYLAAASFSSTPIRASEHAEETFEEFTAR